MKAKRRSAGTGERGHHPKRLLALVFAALLLLSLVPAASADICHYRKPIEIDHARVNADLNDFPVLISITDTDLKDKAQDGGDDIVFTNSSLYRLDHEIEKFDTATGTLVAWVRAPSLSSTTNTTIYMYYNNSECGNQQNPTGVWDSSYMMVQHLEETSGTHYDSTSNDNDGTPHFTPASNQDATGQINGADDFDGSDDYVNTSDSASISNVGNSLTIEGWVYPQSEDTGGYADYAPIAASGGFDINTGYELELKGNTLGVLYIRQNGVYPAERIPLNQWSYVVGVFDDNANTGKIYINGTEKATGTITAQIVDSSTGLYIGLRPPGNAFRGCFDGVIDEVRVSAAARSADWISTSYNNQNDPSTFYSLGEEQNGNPDQPVPELPTIILLSVGLVVLAGYVCVVRKMRKGR